MTEKTLARLLEMPLQGFGHVLLFDASVTELKGVVAVRFDGFLLNHDGRLHLDDRDGDGGAILGKDLRHSQLSSDNPLLSWSFQYLS